ncbi:hypothetical protein [Palleronia sp.]|uniref:hypothetical protein n=1 Tax=Palleronia sp. TaxID=1940284 RepID=UPI0035C7B970
MPPKFHQYRDMAIKAVDGVMAETLRHYPLNKGEADATRTRTDLQGVLRTGNADEKNVAGTSTSWGSRIVSGKARAHFSRVAYPELAIRDGDKLRAMDRAGQPWFSVSSIDDRNHGRLIAELNEI